MKIKHIVVEIKTFFVKRDVMNGPFCDFCASVKMMCEKRTHTRASLCFNPAFRGHFCAALGQGKVGICLRG